MSAQLPEFVDQLVLDGTKVGYWPERIAAWERGERIAPITIDAAWTRKCQYACEFCYASLQANDESKIEKHHAFEFLEDAVEIGVKGVSLISDGESTVVPFYAESIEYAAKLGLAVGVGSNGHKLTKPILERILPHLSYLRFNFSAGERSAYSRIMGVPPKFYDEVLQNVRDAMEIVRRDNLPVTVNLQLVCKPEYGDQIIPFAKLAKEIRTSYCVIKHCADDKEGNLNVDYARYPEIYDRLREAEAMAEPGFRIAVKWNRIESQCKRNYSSCYGPQFILQMSGSGLIAPCGFLFNSKYSAFHIGNITRDRFRDIWASDRYMEVMNYLGSEYWDSRIRCGPGCLQNPSNEFLYAYKNGRVSLPTTSAPPHLEFI